MKLYVKEHKTGKKIYLDIVAENRKQVRQMLGSCLFEINGETYHISEIMAEPTQINTIAGAVLGGIVGGISGPAGFFLGGITGAVLTENHNNKEYSKVEYFNNSNC